MIFLDTTVMSETFKKAPDSAVIAWLVRHDADRRARLAQLAADYEQVVVTAAVEEDVPTGLRARIVRVEAGRIVEATDA